MSSCETGLSRYQKMGQHRWVDQIWQLNASRVCLQPLVVGWFIQNDRNKVVLVFFWLLFFVNKEKLHLGLPTVQFDARVEMWELWECVVKRGLFLSQHWANFTQSPAITIYTSATFTQRAHTHTVRFTTCYWPHYKEKPLWSSTEHSLSMKKEGILFRLLFHN